MAYQTQFPEWLTLASNDGRGGNGAEPFSIVRGASRSLLLSLNTHPIYDDWSTGVFTAELKASPDAVGAPLATWVCATGTPSGGVTPVTLDLAGDQHGSIPADTDGDGVTEVLMQINYTPAGGTFDPIIQTRVLFTGNV